MRYVGKSKVGRLSAKKGKIYPQIRLPPHLADAIGEVADIFETERNGKRAFLIVTQQSVLDGDKVLQHNVKVVKLDDETDYNRRFEALESQISELKSLLLLNESASFHDIKKEAPESGFEPESEPRQGVYRENHVKSLISRSLHHCSARGLKSSKYYHRNHPFTRRVSWNTLPRKGC